jgi:hypothetical protein
MPHERTAARIIDTPSHPGSWQKSRVGVVWNGMDGGPAVCGDDKDNTDAKKRGSGLSP